MFVIPPDPPPEARGHCFSQRLTADGRDVVLRLWLRTDPAGGTINSVATRHGDAGDVVWSTAMTVDGDRYTAVERGPEGELRGEGTLVGPPWAWTGWNGVLHHRG